MPILKLIILTLLFLTAASLHSNYRKHNRTKLPSPLILVPGDGGSRSYANLSYYIFTIKRLLWVNFEYMVFPGKLTNVFKLNYDPRTKTTSDVTNSKVFFPGWGSTEMIEDLDEWKHAQTTYFSPLVQELVKDKYYVRNKTLRGAPYDFRKAPNENQFFVDDFKRLIEDTYQLAGNQRVVIFGHSLGSLYSLYFFDRMTINWKKKFIRSFMSVSAPLGGAVKAVKLHTSGESLGSPRSPIYFREMQRSFPSTSFLLPKPEIFGSKPIVLTAKKNYSAYDFESLFGDMEFPFGSMMYNDTKHLLDTSKSPTGIDELYCIHGFGLQTDEQLKFTDFPNSDPTPIFGDGDGTVNLHSLKVCEKWTNVNHYMIKGAEHMGIVSDPELINKLKQIIYRDPIKEFFTVPDYDLPKEKFIVRVF